ncbi:MAG: hypothetical protein R3F61_14920 [Myxococcota bacterium]
MSTLFKVSNHPDVNVLVERCGYATAALTILPIPGSEILGVMPLHVGMVVGIANYYGHDLTRESATDLILQIGTTVGASLVGSRLATTAAKFVLPGLGGIIAAPFMFASTLAIGSVASAWFANEGSLSADEMRDLYNQTLKRAKDDFRPEKMKDADAMAQAEAAVNKGESGGAPPAEPEEEDPIARLKRAKELLEAGLIEQDEFDALKKRILDSL